MSAEVRAAVEWLASRGVGGVEVGVVLGSGLGAFADTLEGVRRFPYAEVPGFHAPTVVGHAGNLCVGRHAGVTVACLQGRVHAYEGHPVERVVHGAHVLASLGARAVLITNAAGGIQAGATPGDLLLITDHLNLTGRNPLVGPNDAALGPRFPDLSHAYHPRLLGAARQVARDSGVALREGVYAGLLGPTYETPAEVRMLRTLGADAVGMSTVLEVIALVHRGVPVGAVSCITNLAAGLAAGRLDHAEVEATALASRQRFLAFLGAWVVEAARAFAPAGDAP